MEKKMYGYQSMKDCYGNVLRKLNLSDLDSFETFLRKNLYGDIADGMIQYVREVIQKKRVEMSQYSLGNVLEFHFRG